MVSNTDTPDDLKNTKKSMQPISELHRMLCWHLKPFFTVLFYLACFFLFITSKITTTATAATPTPAYKVVFVCVPV